MITSITRNNRAWDFKEKKYGKRSTNLEGTSFFAPVEVNKDNINEYIEWRGLADVLAILNAQENINAQKAHQAACDVDDNDNIDISTWNEDKNRTILETGSARSTGMTMGDIEERLEDLNTELLSLASKLGSGDTSALSRLTELQQEIPSLKEQYAEKQAFAIARAAKRKARSTTTSNASN